MHIGHNSDAPAVTVQDIIALKPKHECPKPWCTRRFTTAAEVSSHVVWHEHREGGGVDQHNLTLGQIVAARGPKNHRYYLVLWADDTLKCLLHKSFGPRTQRCKLPAAVKR